MGETGKRSRQDRNNNSDGSYQKRRHGNNNEGSGDGELVVYRILCPDPVIGGVIGKAGKVINSLRQETHARIKVVDRFPNADKRVITIYCYVKDKEEDVDEDSMEPLCHAQDALLRVHSSIVNALANRSDSDKENEEEVLLLVPSSQAANIIGKSGATIKRLRSNTNANIRVNPKDPSDVTHSCAMHFDNFVQITGDGEAVKKALYAVSAIMYKFSPREEISLDTSVPEQLSTTVIIPADAPIYPSGSFYPSTDAMFPPSGSYPLVIGSTPHMPEIRGHTETAAAWQPYSSAIPVISGFGGPSRTEELEVRVLCPSDRIGRVIGRGGSAIKSIRQGSGAQVDVDDKKKGNEECVINVTSTESSEDSKSAAVEAVLLLQEKINDEDDDNVSMRLLVPSRVIGCIIGKNGSIINDMRKKTRANIQISKGEKPKFATSEDELLEISGAASNLRDALVQIVLRLREDALRDKDGARAAPAVESVNTTSMSVPPVMPNVQPAVSFGYDYDQRVQTERGLGMYPGSNLYGYSSYQTGDSGYGSISSYPSVYGGLPSYIEVLIPSNAVAKVMGKGGTNIDTIQKISGARVDIVESKSSRSERIAQISGTSEQKRSAENLIQAFIMST